MKLRRQIILTALSAFLVILTCNLIKAQDKLTSAEIVEKSQQAFHYAGKDMKAKVLMQLISKSGKERVRELTMLRLNTSESGEQKYYMYFHRPADVRQMTFMVWKYPGKNDDRWLYVPAIKLVRRIAADDKNSSFVGSDFTYEDVSGREVSDDTHTLKGEEALSDKTVYVVESIPRDEKSVYFSRKVSWIDKESFLPLKEEYYDQRGDLLKTFTADKVESVEGTATIMQRTMANAQSGHRTVVSFEAVRYDVGLKDNIFSERYLRNAPREWIQ